MSRFIRESYIARLLCPAIILAVSCFGCRGEHREATFPVHGAVTLDGKPLPFGQVVFHPSGGRIAKGAVKDGRYTLGTYETSDGAVLGRHRITVTASKKLEEDEPGAPGIPMFSESLIPEDYGDAAKSGLEYEVVSGDNVFNIELTSRR